VQVFFSFRGTSEHYLQLIFRPISRFSTHRLTRTNHPAVAVLIPNLPSRRLLSLKQIHSTPTIPFFSMTQAFALWHPDFSRTFTLPSFT